MQRKLTILLIFLFSSFLVAQTNISGTISTDSTLMLSHSPYIVTGNLTVNTGVTLTTEAGVRVEFKQGTRFTVLGSLEADHTVFTSYADSVGGDPQPGYWGNIKIGDYYHSGYVHLKHCEVKYAGKYDYSNIYVYKGRVKIDTSQISYSQWDGVKLMGNSNAEITGSTILNCNSLGIYVTERDTVVLTNSTIQSCQWPIRYDGAASVVFEGLNTLTGNTHDGILMHSNRYNSMVWDTINVPYVLEHDFIINSGDSLLIAPTNVVKSMGGHLYVEGSIRAVANRETEKIVFTSYKDDNEFGDTNGDGFTSAPRTGDWYGIYFKDSSADSTSFLKYCTISFAGRGNTGAITTENASPTITYCTFSNNYYGGMFIGLSNPVFKNNDIGSSQMVPVAMSFEAAPEFGDNTFPASDNQYDAIGLLGGTLRGNAHLPQRTFSAIPNITYVLLGSVTVPNGMTLTIDEGVVIKSYYFSHHLIVKGKFVAEGTTDEPIIFTSVKDDEYGNPRDTNKDGTSSVPGKNDWGGIVFEGNSDDSSILDHCKIQFASLPWQAYYLNGVHIGGGALSLINASPTIGNSLFKDVVYGIRIFGQSNPTVTGCSFENTTYTPVIMSVSANPTFSGNSMTNAGVRAIGIEGEHLPVNGELLKRNFAGFTNITYALMGTLIINSGTEVIVDPGVVVKVWDNNSIIVNGGLKADGADVGGVTVNIKADKANEAFEEIVFTSIKDDNFGNPGDTNGDGNGSSPAVNNWGTIQFEETSDSLFSKLNHCLIQFSGSGNKGGVTYRDASARITNSTISDSYYGIICEGASTPRVEDVDIKNCQADPIAMSLKSNPRFNNISFMANGSKGIKILEGTLSSNATLAKRSLAGISNIAYIINSLTISSNAVLTIEPGVVIKFNTHYRHGIVINGALVANGTPTEKIVFTSIKDDSNGGDTNNDGNNSSPAKGNWRGLVFYSSSSEGLNTLNNCSIRYAGNECCHSYSDMAIVRIYNTVVDMDSCIVEQSSSNGIGIYGSAHPSITNCEINNVSKTPITMSMFATPTFSNNVALNAGIMAIGIKGENYSVNATVPIRNFGGFTNITYYLFETSTINSGTSITIPAGIVFKNGRFDVKGRLNILGSPEQQVVFTDLRDDRFGNPKDTNGDGSLSSPTMTGTRIKFYDVSNDSSIVSNAVFKYSQIAIHLDQASPTLQNILFNKDEWGIYLTGVSTPELLGSMFLDLKYAPIRTSLVSYPKVTAGNIIAGTTYKAIGVLENETLVQDVLLTKRNFAGIVNIPYLFGNYTIASNAILTIEPGVVLKFFPGTGLRVRRGLMAEGGSTPDSIIVFTDLRDDFYGGDTNSDSTETSPWDWHRGWNGIIFENESLEPYCMLKYVTIQYAGFYYSNNYAAIYTNSASPTILNSVLKNNNNALVAKGASNPVINFCDIYDNSGLGVNNVDKSYIINAENNWWGDNSGPTHSGNPGGTGQAVSDGVDYVPWLGAGASNPIMGDVSLNGTVQAFDASKLLKHVSGVELLNPTQLGVADVSGDGSVAAYDASLILQYSVGLISTFPAEAGSAPAPEMPKIDVKTKKYLALQKVENVSLSFAGATAARGEEFSIPVDISNTKGVTALQIEMSVNPELYSVADVTLADAFSSYSISYGYNQESEKLIIAIAGAKPMEMEGELLTINFTANTEIKGKVTGDLRVTKFLANETDFTQNVSSQPIEFIGKPTTYGLNQNYPNPFNPSTVISYQIPEDNVNVKVVIYDINGQIVKTLVNETQNAGRYKVTWNATNNAGSKVSSGVYIYRIIANKFIATKKLMVLK